MINKITNRGFTLIETLVAVLILATAIAGPLTVASRSLMTALLAKDQVTAFYLAQDAVEYVRFKRDTACLAGSPCTNWLGSGSGSLAATCISTACYVDSVNDTITTCGGASCVNNIKVVTDGSGNFSSYGYSSGTASIYNRVVRITNPPTSGGNTNEAKLTVTVSWSDVGSNTHTVTVTENLFNWQ